MNDSENPKSKVSRRTIVGAAAWTAPAIALSVATPAYAASKPVVPPTPTLAILNKPNFVPPQTYTGPGHYVLYYGSNGQGGITERGMDIAASPNGAVPAGEGDLFTVTLPAGLLFSDGSSAKTYFASGDTTSVSIPPHDITVPWGTAPGTYTIRVQYKALTETVGVYVGEGGNVYAWGVNNAGQADGKGPTSPQGTPYPWGYSSDRTGGVVTYTTFTAVTGANAFFAGYSGLYNAISTSGDFNKGIYRRKFDARSVVSNNKCQAADATFYWGNDGQLYAWGVNNADMFSLGDGTAFDGTKSYTTPVKVGVKVLEANPGKTITSVHLGTDTNRVAYILSDKTVWHSGRNNNYSAMGLNVANGGQFLAGQTLKADGNPLTDVVSVAIGTECTIFLDGSGNLWGSGTNNNTSRQLVGLITGYHVAATPLTQPEGKAVSKVWAATTNVIVQTTDGACYIGGENSSGIGSTGSTARSSNAWTRINVAAGKTVADIAFNSTGALYRMTDGTVYFAGNNGWSGAGKGGTYNTAMTQVPLEALAVDIAVTNTNSYAAIIR